MKSIKLFLKNSFKNSFVSKTQLIGLILLVAILSMVTTLFTSVNKRVIQEGNKIQLESNIHDFVVDVDKNVRLQANNIVGGNPSDQAWIQQYYLNELVNYFEYANFEWTRTEARIFRTSTINEEKINLKIVAKTTTSDKEVSVDKLVIQEGKNVEKTKEIVLSKNFAKNNNIKIGDIIRPQSDQFGTTFLVKNSESLDENDKQLIINSNGGMYDPKLEKFNNMNWYQVVGFGTSADFLAPVIDQTTTIPDMTKEGIGYVLEENFGLKEKDNLYLSIKKDELLSPSSSDDIEVFFSGKFSGDFSNKMLEELNNEFFKLAEIDREINWFYSLNDTNYKFSTRISIFTNFTNVYTIISILLILIVISISFFTIILVTRMQVDNVRKQVGYLKSLGYSKREIVFNFVSIPLLASLIGSILGYAISFAMQFGMIDIFENYFTLGFGRMEFNFFEFGVNTLLVWILFTLLSALIARYVIRQKPLELLLSSSAKKISKIGIVIKSFSSKRKFDVKLRTALLTNSLGKIVGVSATMLVATIMLTGTIIIPTVMKENITKSFNGLKFENQIEYKQPLWNNPYTFFKTYNPSNEEWSWEKNGEKNVANIITNFDNVQPETHLFHSPYPTKNDGTNNIDYNRVYQDLLDNNISEQFYTYNIPLEKWGLSGDSKELGKMGYLMWKNLTSDYLENVDNYEVDTSGLGSIALNTLLGQWTDFNTLMNDLNNATLSTGENNSENVAEILRQFYKQYSEGAPLSYKQEFVSGDEINDITFNDSKIGGPNNNWKNRIFAEEYIGANSIVWENKEINNYFDVTSNDVLIRNVVVNNKEINLNNTSVQTILDDSLNPEEDLKFINKILLTWYYIVINNRMGVAILETAYSRAPYFVQQNIKDAILKDENYNISFNIVPFNDLEEERGVMFNAKVENRAGKLDDLKVYGIEENFDSIDLKTKNQVDLKTKLFTSNTIFEENKKVIPIIINESLNKKMDVSINDEINLQYLQDALYERNEVGNEMLDLDNDIKMGIGQSYSSITSEHQKNYYSFDSQNRGWTSGLLGNGDRATINGNKIAGTAATESTSITEVYSEVEEGNLFVNSEYVSDPTLSFKIIGVQEGYGNTKAYIKNEDAKKILNYDKTERYFFERFFVNEYWYNDDALNFIFSDLDENGNYIVNTEMKEEFNLFSEPLKPIYKKPLFVSGDFTFEVNSILNAFKEFQTNANDNLKPYLNKMWTMFENIYPIFNYKNSAISDVQDLTQGFSTNQKYGDYGAIGLNGSLEIDEFGNVGNYKEGFGMGTIGTMLPVKTTKAVLTEMSHLFNMIAILFIILSLIISMTIILLTTNLIIFENKRFIATMTTLGYKNIYIARQIMGMYFVVIIIMFFLGTLLGWIGLSQIFDSIALKTTMVLPFKFAVWLPFSVFIILIGIFISTFLLGFKNIKKIDPILALKIEE